MKTLLLIFFLFYTILATQYVPIPNRQIGLLIGSPNAQVKLQLVYDPICDDSLAFDKIFQSVMNSLTPEIRQKISVRYLLLSLPYHQAAHKLNQGIIYILKKRGHESAVRFLKDCLYNIEIWSESKLRDVTIQGLMQKIAQRIGYMFDVDEQQVLKQLQHGSTSDALVRGWLKLIMGSMKVAGTPRLRINGVTVDGVESMSESELSKLINSLFGSSSNSNQGKGEVLRKE